MLLLIHPISAFAQISFIYFNTSYVVINRLEKLDECKYLLYFNTSYVVINLNGKRTLSACPTYFNTSYVVINQVGRTML